MTATTGMHALDVRELVPPEPLERILAALGDVGPGEWLRVLHRREPWLLFPLLEEDGWSWRMQRTDDGFELRIWRTRDAAAAARAAAATP